MKHTPGPWKAEGRSIYTHDVEYRVATSAGGGLEFVAQWANAQLIAAAPELLEAAEMLANLEAEDGGRGFPSKEECAFARAAIAKATGGTP